MENQQEKKTPELVTVQVTIRKDSKDFIEHYSHLFEYLGGCDGLMTFLLENNISWLQKELTSLSEFNALLLKQAISSDPAKPKESLIENLGD